MATDVYIGGAPLRRNVWTLTVGGTIEAGDLFNVTVTFLDGSSSQTVQATASSTSTATTASDIRTALRASTSSAFARLDYELSGSTVVLSAQDPGIPYIVSVTTTEAGGGGADAQTFSASETIPNGGPNDWNDPGNWSLGAKPTASDVVIISGTDSILYGLDQDAVSINGFAVDANYAGSIGSIGYPLRLTLDDSSLVRIDGRGQYHVNITDGIVSPLVVNAGRLYMLAAEVSTLTALAGTVDIATNTGDAATVTTIQNSGAMVSTGSGVTLTTWSNSAGDALCGCAATTITVNGGTLTTVGTGAVTTANVRGSGVYISNSTGTVTTARVSGGTFDLSRSNVARTISTLIREGGSVMENRAAVTITASQEYGGQSQPQS